MRLIVLCRLTCASLTEDAFGVVQRDIPKIVEALLSFLTALEDFQTELNAKYALPPPEQLQTLSAKEITEKELLAMEAARASEVCSVVTDGECPFSVRFGPGLSGNRVDRESHSNADCGCI